MQMPYKGVCGVTGWSDEDGDDVDHTTSPLQSPHIKLLWGFCISKQTQQFAGASASSDMAVNVDLCRASICAGTKWKLYAFNINLLREVLAGIKATTATC